MGVTRCCLSAVQRFFFIFHFFIVKFEKNMISHKIMVCARRVFLYIYIYIHTHAYVRINWYVCFDWHTSTHQLTVGSNLYSVLRIAYHVPAMKRP